MSSGQYVECHIDLSTAREGNGERFTQSGKKIQVMGASDPAALALVSLDQEGISAYRDMIDQAYIFDNEGFNGFYVKNNAQAGAWIKLVVTADKADFEYFKPTTNNIGNIVAPVQVTGGKTGSTGIVSVGAAVTLLIAADNNRTGWAVHNNSTSIVYIGGPAVAVADGYPIYPGEKYGEDGRDAVYAIVAAGTAEMRVRKVLV